MPTVPVLTAPLDQYTFPRVLRPLRGQIPLCVGSWDPALQVCWFARYLSTLHRQRKRIKPWQRDRLPLDAYFVESVLHRGLCTDECGCLGRTEQERKILQAA